MSDSHKNLSSFSFGKTCFLGLIRFTCRGGRVSGCNYCALLTRTWLRFLWCNKAISLEGCPLLNKTIGILGLMFCNPILELSKNPNETPCRHVFKKLHRYSGGRRGSCFGILKALYEAYILAGQKLSRVTLVRFKQHPLSEYS